MIGIIIVEEMKKTLNTILKIKMYLKKSANIRYRKLSEVEKEAKREYGQNRYIKMKEDKRQGERAVMFCKV